MKKFAGFAILAALLCTATAKNTLGQDQLRKEQVVGKYRNEDGSEQLEVRDDWTFTFRSFRRDPNKPDEVTGKWRLAGNEALFSFEGAEQDVHGKIEGDVLIEDGQVRWTREKPTTPAAKPAPEPEPAAPTPQGTPAPKAAKEPTPAATGVPGRYQLKAQGLPENLIIDLLADGNCVAYYPGKWELKDGLLSFDVAGTRLQGRLGTGDKVELVGGGSLVKQKEIEAGAPTAAAPHAAPPIWGRYMLQNSTTVFYDFKRGKTTIPGSQGVYTYVEDLKIVSGEFSVEGDIVVLRTLGGFGVHRGKLEGDTLRIDGKVFARQ